VLESRRHPRLPEEPLAEPVVARQLERQNLQRYCPVELFVSREIDSAARSFTQEALDSIAGNGRAGRQFARHSHFYHRDGFRGSHLPGAGRPKERRDDRQEWAFLGADSISSMR
jgi:hypothetical protein